MNSKKPKDIIEYTKKPAVILCSVIVLGLLINVGLFSYRLLPIFHEQITSSLQHSTLEKEVRALELTPIPPIISQEDKEKLVKSVPIKDELSRFIIRLREIEVKSGVTLMAFNNGKEVEKVDDLTAYINDAIKPKAAPFASPTPPPKQLKNSQSSAVPVEEIILKVVVTGGYSQIMDFMNQLYHMERIVHIKQWQMQPISGETSDQKIEMTFNMIAYTAKQFAGNFPDLPPLSVEQVIIRDNPIISDELFLQILKSATSH